MRRLLLCLLFFAFGCFALPLGPALAQSLAESDGTVAQIESWDAVLDVIEIQVETQTLAEGDYAQRFEDLNRILGAAQVLSARSQDRLRKPRAELGSLGLAPSEDAPPENEAVRAERTAIGKEIARLESLVKRSELTITRSEELLRKIGRGQRESIERKVLQQGPSLISQGLWSDVIHQTDLAAQQIVKAGKAAWRESKPARTDFTALLWLALAVLFAVFLMLAVRPRILRTYARDATLEAPSYNRRVLATSMLILGQSVVPIASLLAIVLVLRWQDFVYSEFSAVLLGAALGLSLFLAVSQVSRAAFAPNHPPWRIVPVTDRSAKTLTHLLMLLGIVAGLEVFVDVTLQPLDNLGPEVRDLHMALFDLVLAGLLLLILLAWREIQIERHSQHKTLTEKSLIGLRLVTGAMLLATPIMMLLGYIHLADYIVARILLVGAFLSLYLLFRQIFREAAAHFLARNRLRGLAPGDEAPPPDDLEEMMRFWIGVGVDILLALPAIYGLLVTWGLPETEIRLLLLQVLKGIQVGELVISPADIFWGAVVFCVVLFLSRRLQRLLNNTILPRVGLDEGVKQSLSGSIGYLGFALAITLSIATIGVDAAHLAIIFGALSVGIGFGLQHVVNNFVSGLILLFQRPIKVGDWIVVGGNQGYVKRINVIGTEIETFDNASVIVPNSNLVSTDVLNWHHRSKLGRAVLPIRVSYKSDPEQIQSLLLACADAHPDVLKRPEPKVMFQEFGASSLDFELRYYVREIDYYVQISSDLRYAIKKAFDEAGIVIPYPQRDLHIRSSVAVAEPAAVREAAGPGPLADPA